MTPSQMFTCVCGRVGGRAAGGEELALRGSARPTPLQNTHAPPRTCLAAVELGVGQLVQRMQRDALGCTGRRTGGVSTPQAARAQPAHNASPPSARAAPLLPRALEPVALTADIIKVALRVEFQIRAHGQPEVAVPPAGPVLKQQPGDGAPLAHARAWRTRARSRRSEERVPSSGGAALAWHNPSTGAS